VFCQKFDHVLIVRWPYSRDFTVTRNFRYISKCYIFLGIIPKRNTFFRHKTRSTLRYSCVSASKSISCYCCRSSNCCCNSSSVGVIVVVVVVEIVVGVIVVMVVVAVIVEVVVVELVVVV